MDPKRQLRQDVDDLFRRNKTRQYRLEDMAREIHVTGSALVEALNTVVRCPFTSCQSFDTTPENGAVGFIVHHCNRCSRDFHVEHDSNGYSIMGWYAE